MKLTACTVALLAASAQAFAPVNTGARSTQLNALKDDIAFAGKVMPPEL